jgi:hypothetical protein
MVHNIHLNITLHKARKSLALNNQYLKLELYCHMQCGMHDDNNGFWFGILDLLAPWLQVLFISLSYNTIAVLHTFWFTVAHTRIVCLQWLFPGN